MVWGSLGCLGSSSNTIPCCCCDGPAQVLDHIVSHGGAEKTLETLSSSQNPLVLENAAVLLSRLAVSPKVRSDFQKNEKKWSDVLQRVAGKGDAVKRALMVAENNMKVPVESSSSSSSTATNALTSTPSELKAFSDYDLSASTSDDEDEAPPPPPTNRPRIPPPRGLVPPSGGLPRPVRPSTSLPKPLPHPKRLPRPGVVTPANDESDFVEIEVEDEVKDESLNSHDYILKEEDTSTRKKKKSKWKRFSNYAKRMIFGESQKLEKPVAPEIEDNCSL